MRGNIRIAGIAFVAVLFPAPSAAKGAADLSHATGAKARSVRSHRLDSEGETGFATITGERFREGNKRGSAEAAGPSWSRGFSGELMLGEDLGSLGTGMLRLKFGYSRQGSAIGSLLTRKSKSLDRELTMGLGSHDGISASLIAFEKGGWSLADTADFARRAANGENRARTGFGWELGGPLAGRSDGASWVFRMERSRSPGLATESRAMLSTSIGF